MELVELYNNKKMPLEKKGERYQNDVGEYSLVVHVWIMNDKGELLMQKRSANKKTYPGMWAVTGGGNDPR